MCEILRKSFLVKLKEV